MLPLREFHNENEKRMNFKLNVEVILPYIKKAAALIPNRPLSPIYESFCIEVGVKDAYKLHITAGDKENFVTYECEIAHTDGGCVSFCVPAKKFLQALTSISRGEIVIDADAETNTLQCSYETGSFSLPYMDAADYHCLAGNGQESRRYANGSDIFKAVSSVEYATANDLLRPQMGGVRMDFTSKALIAVASDGQKLARHIIGDYDEAEEINGFTLSRKCASALCSACADAGEVKIDYADNYVKFHGEGWTLVSLLLEGRYPNYNAVIPKNTSYVVAIDRALLTKAIKRVLPFGSVTSELVLLDLDGSIMHVSSKDYDMSMSAECTIEMAGATPKPIRIGFKGSNLLQAIENLSGDEIVMEYDAADRPVVFLGGTLALVMPMKIDTL